MFFFHEINHAATSWIIGSPRSSLELAHVGSAEADLGYQQLSRFANEVIISDAVWQMSMCMYLFIDVLIYHIYIY